MQKIDWSAYWQKNMIDLNVRCNFVSRILAKTIFISSTLIVLFVFILTALTDNLKIVENSLQGCIIEGIFMVIMTVLVYSAKVYIIVAPLLLILQSGIAIKHKTYNPWIHRHIILWIVLALFSIHSYNNNKEYENCMEKCVLPDKSNIQECAFNYCDPVF
ncbi:MAG: hypothetical protein IJ770_01305 [Alphaproteobacteria bacterium]|nr:hypothetical protein [Alphaproteobacteria bacterium]